jgi:hypothetical protein
MGELTIGREADRLNALTSTLKFSLAGAEGFSTFTEYDLIPV